MGEVLNAKYVDLMGIKGINKVKYDKIKEILRKQKLAINTPIITKDMINESDLERNIIEIYHLPVDTYLIMKKQNVETIGDMIQNGGKYLGRERKTFLNKKLLRNYNLHLGLSFPKINAKRDKSDTKKNAHKSGNDFTIEN